MIQERGVQRDSLGAPSAGFSDPGVPLNCGACDGLAEIHADVTGFRCRYCGTDNLFCECTHCGTGAVVSLPHGQPLTRWDCPACRGRNSAPLFGRIPVLSARDVQASAEVRGRLGNRERSVTLTEFGIIASNVAEMPVGGMCSLTALDHGITVRRIDDPVGVTFRYDELDDVEVCGRERRSAGQARAGRVGSGTQPLVSLAGVSRGNDSVVRIRCGEQRFVLAHPTFTRDELRSALALMITRWEDAHRGVIRRVPLGRRAA